MDYEGWAWEWRAALRAVHAYVHPSIHPSINTHTYIYPCLMHPSIRTSINIHYTYVRIHVICMSMAFLRLRTRLQHAGPFPLVLVQDLVDGRHLPRIVLLVNRKHLPIHTTTKQTEHPRKAPCAREGERGGVVNVFRDRDIRRGRIAVASRSCRSSRQRIRDAFFSSIYQFMRCHIRAAPCYASLHSIPFIT